MPSDATYADYDRLIGTVVNTVYWYSLPFEQRVKMLDRLTEYESRAELPSDLALVVSICLGESQPAK